MITEILKGFALVIVFRLMGLPEWLVWVLIIPIVWLDNKCQSND